jgi:predicted Kef-type K+ transport protein
MATASSQKQALVLRAAGTVDFLIAIGFLLSPSLGFHLDPLVRNAAAAFLLMGSVAMFVIARRVERLAGQRSATQP